MRFLARKIDKANAERCPVLIWSSVRAPCPSAFRRRTSALPTYSYSCGEWMRENASLICSPMASSAFHGNFTLQGLVDDIKERHPYLVDLERLAIKKGTHIHEVFQGTRIGAFTVLAPTRGRYVNSIPDFGKTPARYTTEAAVSQGFGLLRSLVEAAKKLMENWDIETLANNTETSASNESCVVQYAVLGEKGVLLTADVGPIGLAEAADFGIQLGLNKPKFVQVPHHGSRHNVTPSVLDTWLGPKKGQGTVVGTAFCSVGSNKHDYPRAQVTNAFMRRGFKVYSTRSKFLSHSQGGGHPNMVAAVAEEFANEVEGL